MNKTTLNISERIVLLRIIDIIFILLGLIIVSDFLDFHYLNIHTTGSVKFLTLLIYFAICAQIFELYRLRDSASRFKTVKNLFITTLVTGFVYLYTPFITPVLPKERLDILIFFSVLFVPVFIWRMLYISTIGNKHFYKNILFIGGEEDRLNNIIDHIDRYTPDHRILGYVSKSCIGNNYQCFEVKEKNIESIVKENDIPEIVVSLRGFEKDDLDILNTQIIDLFEKGINVISFEEYLEKIMFCIPKESLNNYFYKTLNFSDNHRNRLYSFTHRVLDFIAGIIGILFLGLIIPFVFVGNILGNRGPLFYGQERVGKSGKTFRILKLRSMVTTAEKDGVKWAQKNDTRITPFGKFLRKSRLDEIPQFWNLLVGDMSLIGPRPERPEFVTELEKEIPFYTIRHVIKPGLTGWAQVMFPYAASLDEQEKKLRYDLYYIKKRNLFIDFKIVIKTINTVLYFKGQ